ncbi:MAG: TIGR01777 family oxidoreductase [Candidatus Latescibacterota bacterium]|nr:MAG: TIGR01777 family oxidoreductase [Candidatus Latescibacterota bacterium]
MATFTRRTLVDANATDVYQWHAQPGAIERLTPPWENVEVISTHGRFENRRVELLLRVGPFRRRWVARHVGCEVGRGFRDAQEKGPFRSWNHSHRFGPVDTGHTVLEDQIEYELPWGKVGRFVAGALVRDKLQRLFAYRHRVTCADLQALSMARRDGEVMNVLISGASGLVGSTLIPFLTAGGHRMRRLGRSRSRGADHVWDPASGTIDTDALEGIDAIVHLAGENIGSRWTSAKKQEIRNSRVQSTRLLAERLAAMSSPPRTLVCASAIGFYGEQGDERLDESSAAGSGFLAEVCRDWEAAAEPARRAGIRVVHLRFGIVLSPRGGPLARMLPPFRMGGGGVIGGGKQYISWIGIDDAIHVILRALTDESLEGPVNAVAPTPVTNAEFTRTLGKVLRRPTLVPLPAFVARALFGEMAEATLLSSARVQPQKLLDRGHSFQHPQLEEALRHLLGRSDPT